MKASPLVSKSTGGGKVFLAASLFLALFLTALCGFSSAPVANRTIWGRQARQYEELTEAISEGQLYLKEEPAAFLSALQNPYDPVKRDQAARDHGSYYLVDTAYFHNRYYIYFGLTPELLLFLPCRMLTGKILPTYLAVIVCALLAAAGAFYLLTSLRRRFFRELTDSTLSMLFLLLICVTGLPYLCAFCTTYSLPQVLGIALLLFGLGFFLTARGEDGSFSKGKLIAGSVLFALTVGCRPLFGIAFLMLFPLFWEEIRAGFFFRKTKEALIQTACVLLPAILCGSVFLVYNALRFGKAFDFGFRYLLTVRDMANASFDFSQTLARAFLLTLQFPAIDRAFPFLHTITYTGAYSDTLYVEPMFGGLFALHPALTILLLLSFVLFARSLLQKRKKGLEQATKQRLLFGLTSFLLAVIILFADAALAGVSARYESDFALFFALPALLAAGVLETALNGKKIPRRLFTCVLLFLLLWEFSRAAGIIFCDGRYYAMKDCNPAVYERVAAWF